MVYYSTYPLGKRRLKSKPLIRNVSNNTLKGVRACMSSFFTWQHEMRYISSNPTRGIDPIKVPKKLKKAYADEDLEMIKRTTKNIRDLAIVEFLYATGVRVAELCSLNRDDVQLSSKEIVVYGKGAKEREVFMTPVSCMYLKMYLNQRTDDNPALFVSLRKQNHIIVLKRVVFVP